MNFDKLLLYFVIFYVIVPVFFIKENSIQTLGLYLSFSFFLASLTSILYPERLHGLVSLEFSPSDSSLKKGAYLVSYLLLWLLTLLGILLQTKTAYITSMNEVSYEKLVVIVFLTVLYIGIAKKGLYTIYDGLEKYRKKYISYVPSNNIYFIPFAILFGISIYHIQKIVVDTL